MQNTWTTQSGQKVEVSDSGRVSVDGEIFGYDVITLVTPITKNGATYVARIHKLALTAAQVSIINNAKPLIKTTKSSICPHCHSYCCGDCQS